METLNEVWQYIVHHAELIIIGLLTFVQISPIKVDPWDMLLNIIRHALVGELEEEIHSIKKDIVEEKINNIRWNVLDYANSCRNGRMHTKDEWYHVIAQLKQYESYVKENNIDNGVMEEETKYLRKLFEERCEKNDFL